MPLVPFLHSPEDIIFGFYILARFTGLFAIAPLLSNMIVKPTLRIALICFLTILVAGPLYPIYRGSPPSIAVAELVDVSQSSLGLLSVTVFKELAVGYLIGLCFVMLYEALMIGGQLITLVMGLSMAEMVDPVSNTSQSVLTHSFTLMLSLLFLTLDLHHEFFSLVAQSFKTIPLGHYHMPHELVNDIVRGSSQMYLYAIRFVAFPLGVLMLATVSLGLMARVMPEMNVFMIAFPLKILLGYFALIISIGFFPMLVQEAFTQFHNLAGIVITHIGLG